MLTIRPATLDDADTVAALYLAARTQFLPYAPIPHTDADVRRWMAQTLIAPGHVRVALLDDRIVGMLALDEARGVRWIDQLYVHPAYVNRGIGSALLHLALQVLTPPIHLYTFQANTGARRFYERHGFHAIAFGDGSGNEEGVPDVLYAWRGDAEPRS